MKGDPGQVESIFDFVGDDEGGAETTVPTTKHRCGNGVLRERRQRPCTTIYQVRIGHRAWLRHYCGWDTAICFSSGRASESGHQDRSS